MSEEDRRDRQPREDAEKTCFEGSGRIPEGTKRSLYAQKKNEDMGTRNGSKNEKI